VTGESGNALVLLHQTVRAVVGNTLIPVRQAVAVFLGSDALVLIDQAIRTVLRQGRQTHFLGSFHFAEYRLFAGRHGERARGEEGKSQCDQLAFHGWCLSKGRVSEHGANFTGAPELKKFKGLMVTIDRIDSDSKAF
jgi:hypothetical protein